MEFLVSWFKQTTALIGSCYIIFPGPSHSLTPLELFVTRAISLAPVASTMSPGQPVHLGSINQGRQTQPSARSDYVQHNDRLSTSNAFVLDGSVCFLPLVRCKFQGGASEKDYFCPLVFGSFEFPSRLRAPYLIKT